jgi:ATP:ADP antiporter, AAA family
MTAGRLTARIHRDEWPLVVLMFCYWFAVITTFWILKPIKKGLFIDFYDSGGETFQILGWQLTASQAEMIAKVGNMVVVFVAVIVFTVLANRLRRQQLTYVFGAFCIVGLLWFSSVLPATGEPTVWSFYIFGDLYNSLMVATFFAFLNDSVSPTQARRLYGPILLGGVCGGVIGSTFVRAEIDRFTLSTWTLICAGITLLVVVVAALAGRVVARRGAVGPDMGVPEESTSTRGGLALDGARLVFRSRYLLAIVGLVGLYEIVSQLLDYQFTATVAHYITGDTARHFSTVYAITNGVALFVQLFLTANIMSRFGVRAALLVMPCVILGASGLFVVLPILWVGSSLNTADNAFNYSINQSARESLYTPLTRDEKYKAKAFIDMFLYRTAKVVAIGVALVVGACCTSGEFTAVRWLSVATMGLLCIWIAIAWYAGGRFHEMADDP